jgi:hypothetical protein
LFGKLLEISYMPNVQIAELARQVNRQNPGAMEENAARSRRNCDKVAQAKSLNFSMAIFGISLTITRNSRKKDAAVT